MRTLSFLGLDAAERPRLSATSIRQLARLGTVVRWPGLLFAAILSLAVPPRSSVGLALVLVWVTLYNAWGMIAISKADDRSILRIGRALTLLDTVSYFLVLFVFGGVGASTSIYAAYILLIVWMVAYDGAEGAILCVGLFVLGMIALHAALNALYGQGFGSRDVVLWSLIMVVAGAILAAYDRIVIGGVLPQAARSTSATIETAVTSTTVPTVRLSPREDRGPSPPQREHDQDLRRKSPEPAQRAQPSRGRGGRLAAEPDLETPPLPHSASPGWNPVSPIFHYLGG